MRRRDFIALLGGTAAWSVASRAQQAALPVIGFINSGSPDLITDRVRAYREGLSESGYDEGRNVTIEYRWAEGQYDRLPALVADLVRRKVSVIVAGDAPAALSAKAATLTIPIVFISGGDVIQIGLVTSLTRPGVNLTGVNLFAGPLQSKQLELLHELVPTAKTVGLLINPNNANAAGDTATVQWAARALGLQTIVMRAVAETDFETVFASLVRERAEALLVNSDILFTSRRDQLVALAAHHSVPALYAWREFCMAGGLISYGPNFADAMRHGAVYTARILNGAKPADLPVLQPTKYELVINLKTAKELGLTVPQIMQMTADEVIE